LLPIGFLYISHLPSGSGILIVFQLEESFVSAIKQLSVVTPQLR